MLTIVIIVILIVYQTISQKQEHIIIIIFTFLNAQRAFACASYPNYISDPPSDDAPHKGGCVKNYTVDRLTSRRSTLLRMCHVFNRGLRQKFY